MKKNAAVIWVFLIRVGEGGIRADPKKFLAFFCAPAIKECWVEKGGGVDQIPQFLGTFSPNVW